METKKGGFVSLKKDEIIRASVESLRREGLKFSVDTLADQLKISKKTVYKYFPDKETLARALYEKYYADAMELAGKLIARNAAPAELLRLYFDSKTMIRSDIFNKYKLNEAIYSYAAEQDTALWERISAALCGGAGEEERKTIRIIVDGAFEKICHARLHPDAVIERLVRFL